MIGRCTHPTGAARLAGVEHWVRPARGQSQDSQPASPIPTAAHARGRRSLSPQPPRCATAPEAALSALYRAVHMDAASPSLLVCLGWGCCRLARLFPLYATPFGLWLCLPVPPWICQSPAPEDSDEQTFWVNDRSMSL